MATFRCDGCDRNYRVQVVVVRGDHAWVPSDSLRGTITCSNDRSEHPHTKRPCNTRTVFEISQDAVTFKPGPLFIQAELAILPVPIRETLAEAATAYFGVAYRAAAAMARVAIEEALVSQGITDDVAHQLEGKLQKAKERGILNDEALTLARGTKLIGDQALHHARAVRATECVAALNIGRELAERIVMWRPQPAKQSG